MSNEMLISLPVPAIREIYTFYRFFMLAERGISFYNVEKTIMKGDFAPMEDMTIPVLFNFHNLFSFVCFSCMHELKNDKILHFIYKGMRFFNAPEVSIEGLEVIF